MAEYIEREALLDKAIEEKRFVISMRDAVHGEWVEHIDEMECSVCGARWDYCDNDTYRFDFCPNCGAKMESWAEPKQVVDDNDLLRAMRRLRVEVGSFICLDCGYEHNCGVHGCAIIRKSMDRIEELRTNEARLRSGMGITSYCVEGPCSTYEPDRILYGDYLALAGTETPTEIREATELLAEQAGECVKKAILEGKVIRSPLGIGWKVEIHRTERRTTDD